MGGVVKSRTRADVRGKYLTMTKLVSIMMNDFTDAIDAYDRHKWPRASEFVRS